jgi:hypothetical protein
MRRIRNEKGQMIALMAVGGVALMGMAGFVLDVGVGFRAHRQAQAAADASALAATQMLPTSADAARLASAQLAAQNFASGTVTLSITGTNVANDTATATATTSTPSFLARVLGVSVFNEKATSRATAGSYSGWSDGLAPWVTDRAAIQWGTQLQFKVKPGDQASSGNFGASRLDIREDNCQLSSGGDQYRDLINRSKTSCAINVGQWLLPQTGNLTGPTSQGLNGRDVIQNFNPYSILKQLDSGDYVLTTYSHPNLVVIPVIDGFNNGNSSPYKVIGFAWFIITGFTSNTVTGMFIGSEVPSGAKCANGAGSTTWCPIGAYNPYAIKVIQLTQ